MKNKSVLLTLIGCAAILIATPIFVLTVRFADWVWFKFIK